MSIINLVSARLKRYASSSHGLVGFACVILLSGCATTPTLKTVDQIPQLMDAFQVEGLAVAVVARDQVLIAQGYGHFENGTPYQANSSCGLYSATKVLASLTYAKLADENRFDLNAPLGAYIEDAPKDWRDIPFYRLLNHTSGITMVVNNPAFGELSSNPNARNRDIYDLIKDAPLDYQPGEYSRYRQSGYAIGEMILQDHLGLRFGDLVEELITRPAKMTNTIHASVEDDTQASLIMSAGGYQTSADDMAKLFLALNSGTILDASYWAEMLSNDAYLFDDYSLGSVLENKNGILTVGHSGGGARANIRYAPDHKVGVMVCTDDYSNNWLAITLARMLIHEIVSGDVPLTPVLVALADHASMSGAEVVEAYKSAANQTETYDLSNSEAVLNQIGYEYLSLGQAADAIEVLAFNTDLHPTSPNTFDSLGEAFLEAGDFDAAIAQYRKVLELDPENQNARKMLAGIEAHLNP